MNEENNNNNNNNNNLNNEENIEEVTETFEETTMDVTEAIEDMTVSVTEAYDNEPTVTVEDNGVTDKTEEPKKAPIKAIIAVIVLIVVVLGAVACKLYGSKLFNKYNRLGYINTSGNTIAQVADQAGMTLEDFLKEYDLPADMPGNTEESAAYYTIPTGKMAEMYGVDFETLKSELELGEEVTETTTWGEAEGTIKVGVYVGGEENLDRFKEYYGLGDDVTVDTLWKDIRNQVDLKNKEDNEAAKKQAEEAENATEAPAQDATADEAPAEDATADEAPAQDATAAPAE